MSLLGRFRSTLFSGPAPEPPPPLPGGLFDRGPDPEQTAMRGYLRAHGADPEILDVDAVSDHDVRLRIEQQYESDRGLGGGVSAFHADWREETGAPLAYRLEPVQPDQRGDDEAEVAVTRFAVEHPGADTDEMQAWDARGVTTRDVGDADEDGHDEARQLASVWATVAEVNADWEEAFADIEDPAQKALRMHLADQGGFADVGKEELGDPDYITDAQVVRVFDRLWGHEGGTEAFLAEQGIQPQAADANGGTADAAEPEANAGENDAEYLNAVESRMGDISGYECYQQGKTQFQLAKEQIDAERRAATYDEAFAAEPALTGVEETPTTLGSSGMAATDGYGVGA